MKKTFAVLLVLVLAAGSAFAAVGDSWILHCRDNSTAGTTLMPYYTDNGADSSACSPVGGNLFGQRYFSTYSGVVGYKYAEFVIDIPEAGIYEIEVTWGTALNRREDINHEVTYKDGATFSIGIDQSATSNEWVSLGQFEFDAGAGMGKLKIDNSRNNLSGSAYVDSVRLTMVQAVPEPSSMLALASGLVGMAGFVVRRKK